MPPDEDGKEAGAQGRIGTLALIGLGLVGSSIARAARASGAADRIVAIDRDPAVVARVVELGIADEATTDAAAGVAEADLVILAVPVGACGSIAAEIALALKPGAIVSDTGSVKGAVVAAIAPHLRPGIHLVPAHPVAGTEHSGPDAGFATLFRGRWCILTPPPDADAGAVARVAAFWSAIGAEVETMSAEHHDLVLAITSHVPHLIAYNIVGTAADLETVTQSEVIKFSAGGFRDFTRIAASDPTMWRDVFLNNKAAVLEMLARLNEDIAILSRAIRWGDGDTLFDLFTRTRAIRRSIISSGQETAEPDFGAPRRDGPLRVQVSINRATDDRRGSIDQGLTSVDDTRAATGRGGGRMKGRRHSRRVVTCRARIVDASGGSHDCVVQDVSDSGARLLLQKPSEIPPRFVLSFGHDRDVTVSLRWQHGEEIGVAFER